MLHDMDAWVNVCDVGFGCKFLYTNTFQPPHQVECRGLVVEIMVTVIQPQKENNPRKALQVARPV